MWNGVVNFDRNEKLQGLIAAALSGTNVSGIAID
jgi:hypothetical protein